MIRGKGTVILFLLYAILGAYFIFTGLNLIELPEFISVLDVWIRIVGGFFIIVGGFNHLRIKGRNRWRY